ncbi:MAG: hypothetical protein J5I81_08760 [Nitrococcus mobilis]|nr:hypothetical protein [Nitrococcus mobilis]
MRRFGDLRYERLASISAAHLYNLRRARGYAVRRRHWTKGQSVAIGARRAPALEGRPEFIRIDPVHQGDQDGVKGLYHINAVGSSSNPSTVDPNMPPDFDLLPASGQDSIHPLPKARRSVSRWICPPSFRLKLQLELTIPLFY